MTADHDIDTSCGTCEECGDDVLEGAESCVQHTDCPACGGNGYAQRWTAWDDHITDDCPTCAGLGRVAC